MTTAFLTLNPTICAQCGVTFGLEDGHQRKLRESGATFYCTNGHSLRYGIGDIGRLKKRLAAAESDRQMYEGWYRREANRIEAMELRAGAGVCQWCHRSFVKVGRHVERKHPEHVPKPTPAKRSRSRIG